MSDISCTYYYVCKYDEWICCIKICYKWHIESLRDDELLVFFFFESVVIYLTLRSISSFNNPRNSEMKFYENMKLTCLKPS